MPELTTTRQQIGGPTRWALHLVMVLSMVACAGGAATETTLPASTSSPTSAPTTMATSTSVAGTTTAPVDVHAIFQQALAASSANYRFHSEVSVGDTTVTTIQGIVDRESVAADVTAGTSQISYIRTPEGEWVTGPDEEWSALEGEAPVGPPLIGLSDITGLELESTEGNSRVLLGTLGPAAGPAAGARVTVVLVGGLISEIRYEAPSGADTATVVTTVTDVGTAGTVAAPEI